MIVLAAVCAGALFMLSGVEAKANGEIEVNSWAGLQTVIDSAPAGTETTVKLTADIVPETPTAADAYINIGTGKKIVLDLNGHIMNRKLSTAQENGMVIKVEGELTLNDSNPTASHNDFTFINPITLETNTVTGGAITGGKNSREYYGANGNYGGGVNVCAGAKFTMNAGSIVACEGYYGGGVFADGEKLGNNNEQVAVPAEFVMNGGLITACVADYGGGVCNYGYDIILNCFSACFTMNRGEIEYCKADYGGGVYSYGCINLNEGKIRSCKAESSGGGVGCAGNRSQINAFIMTGGEICECEAIYGNGGGVYATNVTFSISGGEISNCKVYNDGGGVYFKGFSEFTAAFSGGIISQCESTNNGGGVYIKDSTFYMTDGEISECKTGCNGGGVYLDDSTFNMTGGEINECVSTYNGGGVYLEDSKFDMTGGKISIGKAYSGGGVFIENSTFGMSDGEISRCVGRLGGGVNVYTGSCTITGGTITQCTASQNGQGIYVDSDGLLLITGGNYLSSNIRNDEIHKQAGAGFAQIKSQSISYFNNSEQALVATQDSTNMTVYYYCSSDNATPGAIDFNEPQSTGWSDQVPKASIPGTYSVWVTVKGVNNRTAGPVKITPSPSIPKANPSINQNPSAVQDLVCDGTAKTLVNEGTFISSSIVNNTPPTVLYAVTETNERPEDSAFAEGLPTRTEAGTYYVWYRIPESNYYNSANQYGSIEVVIEEPAEDPAQGTTTTPVVVTPVDDPEPVEEKAEAPKPSIFTRKNKDGSVTTITIIWNADGTTTVITENKQPDGSTEVKEETRDAKGNGTLKIEKKDAEGNLLSKTEGTIKVNKKGTETIKSVTENSDGSKSEKTQKTYKRDPNADNIKKVTISEKKTDAAGNTEEIKTTAFVTTLGAATVSEKSTRTFVGTSGNKGNKESDTEGEDGTDTGKTGSRNVQNVVKEEREYSLSVNGVVKLLSLTSDGEKVTIPESFELDGMKRVVKSIGKNALKGNLSIKEVEIGKNITTISSGAFKNCKNLELIKLTGSVKKIYKNAFKGIAKNAKFVIEASEEDFARIVELLKASGVSETVTFERA
jgi:hypothetical protein